MERKAAAGRGAPGENKVRRLCADSEETTLSVLASSCVFAPPRNANKKKIKKVVEHSQHTLDNSLQENGSCH